MIDKLLEKKPLLTYKGENIYRFDDVHRFIELMPKPNDQGKNPILTDGKIQTE
jgi:hypothetical protein